MADELGLKGKERNEFRSFVIVGFALVLVFSVFLPIFSSSSEAVSTSDQQQRIDDLPEKDSGDPGLKGWMADVKEVQTEEIWHSEVEDPYAGPFETNKTTVYLNLTAHGDPTEIVQPFDWMFSMDTSGSMEGALEDSVNGAKHFVELVEANVSGCRGATIDFGDWEELVNNRHFTEDYEAIKSDLDSLEVPGDTGQGTDFGPPLQKALDEFSYYGNTSRSWFHLFLTDGKSNTGDFWNLVEQHADNDIPIYTIGFGGIDKTTLEDMAEMTGGEFHEAEDPSDLDKVFEAIFDEITSLDKTAVEAPPTNEPMIQEVLPPHLEYIEGSMEVETTPQELEIDMNVREEEGKTIFELKPEREGSAKLNIDDEIHLSYDVRASKYSHDLPITAYDGNGNPESKVKYYNLSSDSVDTIYTPGPKLAVHGYPEPILGTKRPHGFEVGQPVNFQNRTWNEEEWSTWPGDCEIEKYEWDFGDGSEGEGESVKHVYNSPGTYEVTLTATTGCDVNNSVTKTFNIMSPAPPAPPPPPPPSSPPPPGMGIANPTPQPVHVGVGNPMAQPTPVGVGQPMATPQVTMQPVATSQPVGMPTTTAIFAGFMPVAAQRNPAEKIKMSVKNLN